MDGSSGPETKPVLTALYGVSKGCTAFIWLFLNMALSRFWSFFSPAASNAKPLGPSPGSKKVVFSS
jgi:hypothetical protein